MTVDVLDIVRVVANMKLDNLFDVVNTFHFEKRLAAATDEDAFMLDMALYLDDAYDRIKAHVSNRITFVLVTAQNLTKDEILPEKPFPFLTAGIASDDMLPEQLCPYVFWRTPRPRTRSSIYLPPFTEGAWGGAIIPPAALASMQAFGNDFIVDKAFSQGTVRKGAFNSGLLRFSECRTALLDTSYATQRRRKIGVGS